MNRRSSARSGGYANQQQQGTTRVKLVAQHIMHVSVLQTPMSAPSSHGRDLVVEDYVDMLKALHGIPRGQKHSKRHWWPALSPTDYFDHTESFYFKLRGHSIVGRHISQPLRIIHVEEQRVQPCVWSHITGSVANVEHLMWTHGQPCGRCCV